MNRKKPVKRFINATHFVFVCSVGLLCAVIVARAEYEPVSPECEPVPPTAAVEIEPTPIPTEPVVAYEPEPIRIPDKPPKPIREPEPDPAPPAIDYSIEAEYIAKTIYGEARGCTAYEQEQIVWCILNRVDSPVYPDNIIDVIVQPMQFHGYNVNNPVEPEHYEIALDVLARWQIEKQGGESGRNLEPEYLYFYGDGKHNYFRTEY